MALAEAGGEAGSGAAIAAAASLAAAAFVLLTSGRARADDPAGIWYRTSNGCPDGEAFVALVEQRGRTARLVTVGDRVDFVVTLSAEPAGSTGRLERQTSEGIVAVKEISAESCEEVADALALTLALADVQHPASTAPPESSASAVPEQEPRAALPVAAPPSPAPSGSDATRAGLEPSIPGHPRQLRAATWIGAAATGRTTVSPRGTWGAALHLERATRRFAWRVSAHAAAGAHTTTRGDLDFSLWAGQLDLCPVRLGGASLVLRWCGGGEVGAVHVVGGGVGGTDDTGPWGALVVRERLRWPADRPVAFEADLGVFLPLTSYHVVAERPRIELHRMGPAGLVGGAGVSIHLK